MGGKNGYIVTGILIYIIAISQVPYDRTLVLNIYHTTADNDRSQVIDSSVLLGPCLLVCRAEGFRASAHLVFTACCEHDHFGEGNHCLDTIHLPAGKRASNSIIILLWNIHPVVEVIA